MNSPILAQTVQKSSIEIYPNVDTSGKTQKQRVLERLQNGERLSVRKIHTEMWINSPTKVLSNLRKDGHEIRKCRIETMAGSHFYIYFMGEWKIDYIYEFYDEIGV